MEHAFCFARPRGWCEPVSPSMRSSVALATSAVRIRLKRLPAPARLIEGGAADDGTVARYWSPNAQGDMMADQQRLALATPHEFLQSAQTPRDQDQSGDNSKGED